VSDAAQDQPFFYSSGPTGGPCPSDSPEITTKAECERLAGAAGYNFAGVLHYDGARLYNQGCVQLINHRGDPANPTNDIVWNSAGNVNFYSRHNPASPNEMLYGHRLCAARTNNPGVGAVEFVQVQEAFDQYLERHSKAGRQPVPALKAIRPLPEATTPTEPEDAAAGMPAFLQFLETTSADEFKKVIKDTEEVVNDLKSIIERDTSPLRNG
jgi:hypothetical protein